MSPTAPVTGTTGTAAVPPALWDALDQAIGEVEQGWLQIAEDSPSQEEVHGHLVLIREGIADAVNGAHQADERLPKTVLSRRLLELVRRHLLARVSALGTPPQTATLLPLLTAMETVSHSLEPDWAQHFADRLSGPDGMDLVVEVAHDLRSPLTSILFLSETLQRARSGPINAVQERQLGLIYSAAFGLSSMASDVIELARGGDRLVDLDPLPFSVADIFESVRDIVQPIAEEKGLQVVLHFPELDFRVGYPVALSRVLLNLTTNALKFTSEGVVEIRADAGEGNKITFSVRDTGRGIPPTAMLTLFEPFRRRQKQGEYAFSGAGLGLSICRKLVEAMRATLKVETGPESGTRFYFELDLPSAADHP